jgi:AAA domain
MITPAQHRANVARLMGEELPPETGGEDGPGSSTWPQPPDLEPEGLEAEAEARSNGHGVDLHEDGTARRLVPVSLDTIGPEAPVRCVVEQIALAEDITGVFGDGDAGKSTLLYLLALCVVLGLPLFGRFAVTRAGRVLIVTSGEDRAALIRNRLVAFFRGLGLLEQDMLAALARVHVLDAVERPDHPQHLVNLDDLADLLELQRLIATHDYRLVIFDPIADLIGDRAGTLEDRDARRIYRHIRTYLLAGNPDLGAIVSGHSTKDHKDKTKRQRVFGAAAWTNSLRACWFVERTADGFTVDSSVKGNRWATRHCHRITRTVSLEADGVTWRAATLTLDTTPADSDDVVTVLRVVRRAKQAPNSRDLEVLVKGEGLGADRAGLAIGQAKARGWIISPESGRAKAWVVSEPGRARLALKVSHE